MRLLTHNMLSSNIKGVTNGFPLKIEPQKIIERSVEFNPVFLKNMFAKLEWKPLVEASRTMGYLELPEDVSDLSVLESEEFLHKFHHALLEIHLEEGALVCPETGRKFPVQKGIPNMMLHEDEIRYCGVCGVVASLSAQGHRVVTHSDNAIVTLLLRYISDAACVRHKELTHH